MKLLIWIIKQMKQEGNFKYFTGQFKQQQIKELKKILSQQNTVSHSRSNGNGMNHYSNTDWYSWIKKENNSYFEMRVDNNKYIGGTSKVTIWQWDTKEESQRVIPQEKVYKDVGNYRNGGKPKLMTI